MSVPDPSTAPSTVAARRFESSNQYLICILPAAINKGFGKGEKNQATSAIAPSSATISSKPSTYQDDGQQQATSRRTFRSQSVTSCLSLLPRVKGSLSSHILMFKPLTFSTVQGNLHGWQSFQRHPRPTIHSPSELLHRLCGLIRRG
jgi:hypothetical protein